MKLLALAVLLVAASANVLSATDAKSVAQFREANSKGVASLLFHDKKNTGLFTLFGLFAAEPTDSAFEARMSEHTHMLKVDVSNPELKEVKDYYEVETVPWIVVLNHGQVAISESPGPETEDKIIELVKEDLGEFQQANSNTPRGAAISPVSAATPAPPAPAAPRVQPQNFERAPAVPASTV